MRRTLWINIARIAGIAAFVGACSRSGAPPIDDALKNDLALASQTQPSNAQQTMSPGEAAYAPQQQRAPRSLASVARQQTPVRRAPVRRSSATNSSASSSSSGSSGGYYPAPTPPTTIEKNTGRDAAIGAVAGAVIGATSSRNKVQGGLIGAAIGGILGGVVGNNVDIKRKTGW